jgi:hypothetical protein
LRPVPVCGFGCNCRISFSPKCAGEPPTPSLLLILPLGFHRLPGSGCGAIPYKRRLELWSLRAARNARTIRFVPLLRGRLWLWCVCAACCWWLCLAYQVCWCHNRVTAQTLHCRAAPCTAMSQPVPVRSACYCGLMLTRAKPLGGSYIVHHLMQPGAACFAACALHATVVMNAAVTDCCDRQRRGTTQARLVPSHMSWSLARRRLDVAPSM